MRNPVLPATLNSGSLGPDCDLDYIRNQACEIGQNCPLLVGRLKWRTRW